MKRTLACLALVAACAFPPAAGRAQAPAPSDEERLLSAFAAYVDLRVRDVQKGLDVLAATAEAQTGQWEKMKGLVGAFQAADGGLVAWWVLPDGTYFTGDKGRMEPRLSDRPYFRDLLAGKPVLGALVVSRSTGQRSAVIAVPLKRAGKVVGALGASLFLDRLSDEIAAILALDHGASFWALAPNGLTVLHSRADRHFVDPRELGSPSLKQAADEMLSKTAGTLDYEYDQVTKRAIFRTSPLTLWRFVLTSGRAGP